jgi:hypothetical protein
LKYFEVRLFDTHQVVLRTHSIVNDGLKKYKINRIKELYNKEDISKYFLLDSIHIPLLGHVSILHPQRICTDGLLLADL